MCMRIKDNKEWIVIIIIIIVVSSSSTNVCSFTTSTHFLHSYLILLNPVFANRQHRCFDVE